MAASSSTGTPRAAWSRRSTVGRPPPASFDETAFIDPATGLAWPFATVISSGRSVGVPGTPATWQLAAERWGTERLGTLLKPAERIARNGFDVDQTFHDQTVANATRFAFFTETARVFLPGGEAPAVGSVFRNPDLAKAYRELRTHGVDSLYSGRLGEAVVAESRDPSTAPGVEVLRGELEEGDLEAYRALVKAPVHSEYRGKDVYGMPVPSSGGIAVGEILNLVEAYDERTGTPTSEVDDVQYLHRFSEASATAFADRNRWVGDVSGVPTEELVSQAFADERACLFDPTTTITRAGAVRRARRLVRRVRAGPASGPPAHEDVSTTHLSVVDRWGNAVAYTSTIEATGGSGHHGARLGLPPQQRAHRLQLRALARQGCPTPTCPARASARAPR